MSKMGELFLELEEDFEKLAHTSMVWDSDTWLEQVADGRFEGRIDWNHNLIFWFDNYASVVAAKNILREFGEDYSVLLDDATGEWAMTTTLLTNTWRAQ